MGNVNRRVDVSPEVQVDSIRCPPTLFHDLRDRDSLSEECGGSSNAKATDLVRAPSGLACSNSGKDMGNAFLG